MSLSKFSGKNVHRGKRIFWGRSSEDGLPFRSPTDPMYSEDEFEARVTKVGDPHAYTFNLSIQQEKTAYLQIIDGIVNGWFQCLYVKRWEPETNPQGLVRLEWVEFFLEDGKPVSFLSPKIMEAISGNLQSLLPPTST